MHLKSVFFFLHGGWQSITAALLVCEYAYVLFQGKCFYEMVLFQRVFLIMYILFVNDFSKTLR